MPYVSKNVAAKTREGYSLDTSCFSATIEPLDKGAYKFIVEIVELQSLTLALVCNTSAIIERKWEDMSAEDAKHFAIMNVLEGEMMITASRGATLLKSGEFLLTDNTQPLKIFVNRTVKVLIVYAPRSVLKRYIPDAAEVLSQVIRIRENDGGRAPFSPILKLWQHLKERQLEEFSVGISNQFLRDISDAYAQHLSRIARSGHALQLKCTIREYIDKNLGNPRLSIASVASEFKISSRYVRSLFAGSERLSVYIQRRRMEKSATLLTSARYQSWSITKIAQRCGFKSSTAFSRCFRSHFHETARDFRSRYLDLLKRTMIEARKTKFSPPACLPSAKLLPENASHLTH